MAEVSKDVLSEKVTSISEFKKMKGNISAQAISYAIENDLVDYIDVAPRIRIIVLTKKSKDYEPNSSKKRYKSKMPL